MHNQNSSNPMQDQVYSVPQLIRDQIWALENDTRKVLTTPEIFGIRQIVLTGCGDSHISGMATEQAFNQLSQIPTQATSAMQASRYDTTYTRTNYPYNPLVIAVSNSGDVARVVEATKNYCKQGALTVAITSNPESRLAKQSDRIVQTNIPFFPASPGVRTYMISLLTLYLIAIRLGEVRGVYSMDVAMALRQELASLAGQIETVIEATDATMKQLAQEWRALRNFEFLGSGCDRATAAYGTAKLLEAVGVPSLHQDMEEWVHLQYFVRNTNQVGSFIIAPPNNNAMSRIIEIEPLLRRLERPYRILCGKDDARHFDKSLVTPCEVRPVFAPLVYSIPFALFAAHLSQEVDETYGRGAVGKWEDCADGMTTRNSQIL